MPKKIPRDPEDDYTAESAAMRRAFIEEQTGAKLEHTANYSSRPRSQAPAW